MRQIKFRAWHKESRMMHEVKGIDLVHHGGLVDLPMFGYAPLKKVILMQFTGLHDRNGKEIYEGDIVKTERMTYSDSGIYIGTVEVNGEVVFTNGRYALHLSTGAMPDLHFGLSYHVVLGNRFEHPHLLEG
jgi:uncharacterized phage protein (TIGR01671 family)